MIQNSTLIYSDINQNTNLESFLTHQVLEHPKIVTASTEGDYTYTKDFVMIPSERFLTYRHPLIIFNLYTIVAGRDNLEKLKNYCNNLGLIENENYFIIEIASSFDDVRIAARNDKSYDYDLVKLRGYNLDLLLTSNNQILPVRANKKECEFSRL